MRQPLLRTSLILHQHPQTNTKLQHPKLQHQAGYQSIMSLSRPLRSGSYRPTPTSQSDGGESFALPSRQPKSTAEIKRMETVCRNMVEPEKDLILRSARCPSCAVFISLLSPSPTLSRSFPLTHQHTHSLPRSPLARCFHSRSLSPLCREMLNSLQLTH